MEYGQIFHVTRIGKYYCKNMKYRINIYIYTDTNPITLEKWFPLQGEQAQSLKVFNVHMLGFKNKIEMRKKRQNNRPINLPQDNNILHILHVHPKLYIKGIYNFQ